MTLTASIGIPSISAPGSALAAEHIPTSVNENIRVDITDVPSELKEIGTYYYTNEIAERVTLTFQSKPDSVETKVDLSVTGTANDLKFDSAIVEYVGEKIFENTTDQTQKLTTSNILRV
ncbi:hypothetical protein BK726_18680 [Bacillus thuringiensis serovar londrina]|uniref:Uncharacterized protein n=1 Tax=Bacillus thuringiensis TaxID=1428 RepID=A0A1B2RC73_BACTU|nr:hypothetical protein [Bacillus thuringiensis]AOB42252.1 hypothetical protein pFR260_155 [Bacillus thuringiensis]OMH24045.1 hypothetical protein BUM91_30730 [Bacillus thuringiensis]OTX85448.1 hypothetical protein BK726_18680 [Bacillus thuringiensis serovar londrina]